MEITQVGKDCKVTLDGVTRYLKDCDALYLANALYDKDAEKYSDEEMREFGFKLRNMR